MCTPHKTGYLTMPKIYIRRSIVCIYSHSETNNAAFMVGVMGVCMAMRQTSDGIFFSFCELVNHQSTLPLLVCESTR